MLHEFAARIQLYSYWHARLRGKTQFFCAAALTNAALVELCLLRCRRHWIGDAALGLLSTAGRHLEPLNIETATRIERGIAMPENDFDESLVVFEQAALEDVLRQEGRKTPNRYGHAVQQINRLLRALEHWPWPLRRWPNAYLYRGVLRQARLELGHRPDFALFQDRVSIGSALIRKLERPNRRPVSFEDSRHLTCGTALALAMPFLSARQPGGIDGLRYCLPLPDLGPREKYRYLEPADGHAGSCSPRKGRSRSG